MPLVSASVHVASVRAPEVVFTDLAALAEGEPGPGMTELVRALEWIAAKCSTPGGIAYAYQDPESGELHRLPASELWRCQGAQIHGPASTLDEALEPFRLVALRALGLEQCQPALQIVVPRAELDAHLDAEMPMAVAWLAMNLEDVVARIQQLIDSDPVSPIAQWARTLLERQLPMIVAIQKAIADEPASSETEQCRRISTKEAVAHHEAEYRARWENAEFATSAAARRQLWLVLNSRPDGTVAKPGDRDHHTQSTVNRRTQGWFPKRPPTRREE